MKKLFIFLLLFIGGFSISIAQDKQTYEFRNQLRDTSNLNLDYSLMGSHFLGNNIARRMYRFEKTYTFQIAPTAMSPGTKTVVNKPTIYYTVNRLNKYFRNGVRKNKIETSDAIVRISEILDLAFVIYSQDTEEFEAYLKKNKSPEHAENAFNMIVLK